MNKRWIRSLLAGIATLGTFAPLASADRSTRPLVSPPLVEGSALDLDGRLDEGLWKGAQLVYPLVTIGAHERPLGEPRVLVARDDETLYVGFDVPLLSGAVSERQRGAERSLKEAMFREVEEGGTLRAEGRTSDSKEIGRDDHVEVYFAGGAIEKRWVHFMVNPRNARFDRLERDVSWNGRWESATSVAADGSGWSAEFAIPLSHLVDRDDDGGGETLRMNACVVRNFPSRQLLTWAHADESFLETERYGSVRLDGDGPAVGSITWDEESLAVDVASAGGAATATLRPIGGDEQASSETRGIEETVAFEPQWRLASAEAVVLQLSSGDGSPMVRSVIPRAQQPMLAMDLRKLSLAKRKLMVDVFASLTAGQSLPELRVLLRDPSNAEVASAERIMEDASASFSFDTSGVTAGSLELSVEAMDPTTRRVLHRETRQIAIPKPPEWFGNDLGKTTEVPEPWTAVKTEGDRVEVWNRSYRFAGLPMPAEVVSDCRAILPDGVELELVVSGERDRLTPTMNRVVRVSDRRAVVRTRAEGSRVRVVGDLWVEFDGVIRSDWRIEPKGEGETLDRLTLRFPMRPKDVTLYNHVDRKAFSVANSRGIDHLGPRSLVHYLWIGNEDRGFAWFFPSDESFAPSDPCNALRVVERQGRRIVEAELVGESKPLDDGWATTLGFQATPVKPWGKTATWDHRITREKQPLTLFEDFFADRVEATWSPDVAAPMDRGRLSFWIRPQWDPQGFISPQPWHQRQQSQNLFTVTFGEGEEQGQIRAQWHPATRRLRVLLANPGGPGALLFDRGPLDVDPWEQGRWRRVDLTWGDRWTLSFDGTRVAQTGQRSGLFTSLDAPKPRFRFGQWRPLADVDEVEISTLGGEPARLGFDGSDDLAAMDFVMNYEPLDESAKRSQLVDGVDGQALALRRVPLPLEVEQYQKLGVKTLYFHCDWSSVHNASKAWSPERINASVRAAQEHGMQVIPYFGFLLSDLTPTWQRFGSEMEVLPKPWVYKGRENQAAHIVSVASPYADWLLSQIDHALRTHNFNGVYLDSTADVWPTHNAAYGQGYEGDDGQRVRTYPFFETRETMQRIYQLVKKHDPDGQVNAHVNGPITTPSAGYATGLWNGELLAMWGTRVKRIDDFHATEYLPLDAFRAAYMGRAFGIPVDLLVYGRPFERGDMITLGLLHDVLPRPSSAERLVKISRYWRMAEHFGKDEAIFLPYWRDDAIQPSGDEVYATAHVRGDGAVLLIIANTSRQRQSVTVPFGSPHLPTGQWRIVDRLGIEPAGLDRSGLRVDLPSMDHSFLWLER